MHVVGVARSFLACCALLPAVFAMAGPVASVVDRPAMKTRLAAGSAMMDVCEAGDRLVAVGERGIALLSDDTGRTWRQAGVPVSVSLTAVQFVDARVGWAVGHSGVVLHSTDGGETWQRQLDGKAAAALALSSAHEKADARPDDAQAQRDLATATQWTQDGPDKPFLALLFEDGQRGFVVGAYGMVFHTSDGGRTWTSLLDKVPNPDGLHIYAIRREGRTIYLSGEQGYFARSDDDGLSFTQFATPRKVSLFAMAVLPGGGVIAGGLRGNTIRSDDRGKTWQVVELGSANSISALHVSADLQVVIATQGGRLLRSASGNAPFMDVTPPSTPPINAFSLQGGDDLVVAGPRGVSRLELAASVDAAQSASLLQKAR